MLHLLFTFGCSSFEEKAVAPQNPIEYSKEEKKERRTKREKRKRNEIAKEVSCLRGKEFSPVPFLAHQDTEEFAAFLQKDIDKDFASPEGMVFEYTLKGMRFLPFDYDLKKSFVDMMEEQAAAYYNQETDGFYIVQSMSGFMLDVTIAHELQHSLQDQHTDQLEKYSSENFHSFDHEMATRFLIEGEATLIGNAWLMQDMGALFGLSTMGDECLNDNNTDEMQRFWISCNDFFRDTAFVTRENSMDMPKWLKLILNFAMPLGSMQESLDNLPQFHYYLLNTPYLRGSWYAYNRFQQSGWKRSGLDALFENPPQTTEQVLHPEQEHSVPPLLSAAKLPASITKGWKQHTPNTMGELSVAVWLIEHGMPEKEALMAAEGWNGDRVQVWTKSNNKEDLPSLYAVSWVISWDNTKRTNAARVTFQEQIKKSFPEWKTQSWGKISKKGSELFTYNGGNGGVSWNKQSITLWWGF